MTPCLNTCKFLLKVLGKNLLRRLRTNLRNEREGKLNG